MALWKNLSCFRKLAVGRLGNCRSGACVCFCRPVWNELAGTSDYFSYLFASFKDCPVFKLPNQTHTDMFPNYFPPSGQKRISHEAPPFWTQHRDHAKVETRLKHVSQCSGAVWIHNLRPVPLGHIKTCHTIVFWVREECYKINTSPSEHTGKCLPTPPLTPAGFPGRVWQRTGPSLTRCWSWLKIKY